MRYLHKLAPLFLVLATVGDCLLPYVTGAFYPNYHPQTMLISQLGEAVSPIHSYFNAGSILTGTLFILAGVGVHVRFFKGDRWATILFRFALIIYGFGDCMLSGLVKISETDTFFSPNRFIHSFFSGVGMTAMLLIPLLLGICAYANHKKGWLFFYSACFIGALLSLGLFASFYLPTVGNILASTRGLWQRSADVFLYLPPFSLGVIELYKQKI